MRSVGINYAGQGKAMRISDECGIHQRPSSFYLPVGGDYS